MPDQALALALAASIYPPAVAAVIALGRGEQLRSRVFAFVLAAALTTYATGVLLLTLYILPSPIYIAAVKAVADAKLSTSGELLALAATVAVMLWMVELPMLILLIVPHRAERALDQTNRWFARNRRTAAIVASVGAGGTWRSRGWSI